MDSFVISPEYVDFLSEAIPVFIVVIFLCAPFLAFFFRLGWWLCDSFKEGFELALDIALVLFSVGYIRVKRFWYRRKGRLEEAEKLSWRKSKLVVKIMAGWERDRWWLTH